MKGETWSTKPWALCAALLALAAGALVAHSLAFNFVTDDAFISFVYARNLARHGQLVFNLGERVEGYTNFLWTVLLAGLMRIGLEPERTSRVLGTGFAIATLVVCAWISRRLRPTPRAEGRGATAFAHATAAVSGSPWSAWEALPALILAGIPGFACWASGGLETQMFSFFITLGAGLYLGEQLGGRPPRRSAIAFAMAALTRPEGSLFFALTVWHRLLLARRLRPARSEIVWIGWFALLVAPHFIWRRLYYGWWLPNTYYIKAVGGAGTFGQGGYYLVRFIEQSHLWALPILYLLGLARAGRRPEKRGALLAGGYTALLTIGFLLYVVSVGGDFMGLGRFALPVVPLLVVLGALGLRLALGSLAARAAPAAAMLVALLLGVHAAHSAAITRRSLAFIGADHGIDTPGYLRWYTADRAAIGKWFGRHAQSDDYAAVGGAGAQVYYSGIRSLDCYGLSDAYIAHRVRAHDIRPGHQKYAPLDYQLARRPTIITSNYYRCCSAALGSAPYTPSAAERDLWWRRGYHYVSAEIPGLSWPWYSFLLRNDRRFGPFLPMDDSP